MTKELFLNSVFLKNRVIELGIKQWWLAEQVGVDRKTVIRWMQGKVKSIKRENAEALAKVLDCCLEDICHADEAENLASPEDQRIAAGLLVSSSLVEKLGPIGEWKVIESLLKATIVPQLPLSVLGDLYNQLTVASWRQSKIDQAELYNAKSLEIAERAGDKKVRAEALFSMGNLLSWRGKTRAAIAAYNECLGLKAFISAKTIGSIYSNLGAVYYERGDLADGLVHQESAVEYFHIHGRPTNLSIAYCHEAMIFLQMEKWSEAQRACDKSREFAIQDDYRRGVSMCGLIEAELLARNGNEQEAVTAVKRSLDGFSKMGIDEGLNFEFAGRVHRLTRRFAEAQAYTQQGIKISQSFPLYLAALYAELAQILMASGAGHSLVLDAAVRARDIYRNCEAPARAEALEKTYNISKL